MLTSLQSNSQRPRTRFLDKLTGQPLSIRSSVRRSITHAKVIMDDRWQTFVMDDIPPASSESPVEYRQSVELDYELFENESDTSNVDDDAFKLLPENPRIKCLRFEKYPGITPPYCATAPAYFPRNPYPDGIKLGQNLRCHNPSPLRNIALSNVPKWSLTGAIREQSGEVCKKQRSELRRYSDGRVQYQVGIRKQQGKASREESCVSARRFRCLSSTSTRQSQSKRGHITPSLRGARAGMAKVPNT